MDSCRWEGAEEEEDKGAEEKGKGTIIVADLASSADIGL